MSREEEERTPATEEVEKNNAEFANIDWNAFFEGVKKITGNENYWDVDFGKLGPQTEETTNNKIEEPIRVNDEAIPDLPEQFRERFRELGFEQDALLVIQKPLLASDVQRKSSRFSIPRTQIRAGLFTEEEDAILRNSNEEIEVQLIDPRLKVTEQMLKRYALKKNWYKGVVEENKNDLEKGRIVQLWMARNGTAHICFALVLLPQQEGEAEKNTREKLNAIAETSDEPTDADTTGDAAIISNRRDV